MRRTIAVIASLCCLAGCGGAESEAGRPGSGGGTAMLADVALWGYLRIDSSGLATEAALGPVSFDAIRQSTDNTLALTHASGFT